MNQDRSVQRDFQLRPQREVRLGVEVFNLFNTVVFGGIDTNITNANVGWGQLAGSQPRAAHFEVRMTF